MKKRLFILALAIPFVFSGCNDFNRIVKGTDSVTKYEIAMDYFDRKDYNKALQLFDLLSMSFRNTPKGEDITYRTAECYYLMHDYEIASYYYAKFVQTYPFSKDAERAAYLSAYCSYLLSPESSLDQTKTNEAIKQIKGFIERYPNSDSIQSANKLIEGLNEKLEQKDYDICKLFYRMESYNSAITAFENLLKKYPTTKHREEILFDMAETYYDYAENSVTDKQRERYEACIEQCNTLAYLYPESEKLKDVQAISEKARKKLENLE